MTTYWLSRNGGDPEGPFAQSQIISMWGRGQFTATDQLCEEGAHDWQPASFVMKDVDAGLMAPDPRALPVTPIANPTSFQRPTVETLKYSPRRDKSAFPWGWMAMLILVAGAGFVIFVFCVHVRHTPEFRSAVRESVVKNALDHWVKHTFADKDAEIMTTGRLMNWHDGELAIVAVRARNSFGGPIINHFVVALNDAADEVTEHWRVREWLESYESSQEADIYRDTVAKIKEARYLDKE